MNDAQDFSGTGNSDALINSGTNREQALASGDAGAITPQQTAKKNTPWYLSRTFWINAAALVSLLVPSVRDWLESNPVEFTTALGAVNVLLRFVTVGKYQFAEPTGGQDGGADESAPRASHTSGRRRLRPLARDWHVPGHDVLGVQQHGQADRRQRGSHGRPGGGHPWRIVLGG